MHKTHIIYLHNALKNAYADVHGLYKKKKLDYIGVRYTVERAGASCMGSYYINSLQLTL